jgi:two-component system, NarL family, response regulator NreC
MPIRVVIIEDHPLMLKAVSEELSIQSQIQVVGTATHGAELRRLVRELSPDVVILDLGMSTGNFEPITEVRAILRDYPDLRILVLTGYDDEVYNKQIIDAGALGYVLKSEDLSLQLPRGVQRVYEGRRFYSEEVVDKLLTAKLSEIETLTEKEQVSIRLAASGKTNTSIAQQMKISEKHVRNLLSTVYAKFGLHDSDSVNIRIAAINKARDLGLLPSD